MSDQPKNPPKVDQARTLINRGNALSDQGDLAGAVAAYDEAIAIRRALREELEPRGDWSPELRNDLAAAHMNRGNALSRQGDLAGAVAAHDEAIAVRRALREELEPHGEWAPALRNDLAKAHMNRGVALSGQGDLAGAVAAYDEAIALMSGLREVLEPRGQWSPELRNDLAYACVNRGNALLGRGDLAGAVAAYDEAIAIMSGLREVLEPRGQWAPELRNDLAAAHMNRGVALSDQGDLAGAVAAYDEAIALRSGLREVLEPRGQWAPALRNDLAKAHMNRGSGLFRGGDLAGAVAAYDEAIAIMSGLREVLEPRGQWSPELRNALAVAHLNRGSGLFRGGDLAGAVAAYDEAIAIMSGLREVLEPRGQWAPELRNDLAAAHMNRGVALSDQGDLAGAVAAYDEAIALMSELREVLEPRGQWSPALRNALAGAHVNRGVALSDQGDLAGAVAAYDEAIALMSGLREVLEPRGQWAPELRNDLAVAHINRGNALSRQGDLAGALAAYDEAIALRSGLREELEPRGQWSPELRNDLAGAHMNRGNALSRQGDLAGAVAAYDEAIALRSGLREVLEPRGQWAPELRNDLAAAHMNRGNALSRQGDLAGAVAAYDEAIALRSGLREVLEPRGQWSPELRNDLAVAHMNRGSALSDQGDLAGAVAAYDEAIAIMSGLREVLEPRGQWAPELRNDLAKAHMNRGNALSDQGDLAGAVAAYDEAIALMSELREVLEPRGQWSPELRNALAGAHVNRGVALSRQGDLAGAVVAYDEAIALMSGLREVLEPRGQWAPELRNDLASAHINRGNALSRQGDLAGALEAFRVAEQLHDGPSGLGRLPQYDRDRLMLWSNMASLLSEMDDAQAWAVDKGRRMSEIMELAPSATTGGRDPWDEARTDFARFHALWLKYCLDTGATERIPGIVSAIQGRELATRILDELSTLEGADELPEALQAYQEVRRQLREKAEEIRRATNTAPDGSLGGGGENSRGMAMLGFGAGGAGPARRPYDAALVRRLDEEYRALHGRLAEVREAAAREEGYAALSAPRLDAGMLVDGLPAVAGSGLGENEALVLFLDVAADGSDGGIEGALVLRHGHEPAWWPLPDVRGLSEEIDRVSHRLGTSTRMGVGFRYAGQRADGRAGQRADGGAGAAPEAKSAPEGEPTSQPSVGALVAEAPTVAEPEADLSGFWDDMEERIGEQVWQPLTTALEGIGQVVCITQGRLHLLPLDLGAPEGKTLRHYPGLVYYGYRRGLLGRSENRQQSRPTSEGSSPSTPTIGLVGYGGERDTIPFVWGEVEALHRLHEGRGSVQTGDPYDHRRDGSASPTDYALLHLACHGIPVGEGMHERVVLQLGPGRLLDMGRIMESRLKVDQVLIAACLGGKVREDLDGEPSGVVGGYLYRGTAEVAAAVVALPDSWTMLASILIHQAWLESGSLGAAVAEGKRRLAEGTWYPDTGRLFKEAALFGWRERHREPLRQELVHALTYHEDEWNKLVAPLRTDHDPDRYAPSELRKGAEGEAWGERIEAVATEVADRLLDPAPLRQAIDEILTRRIPPQPLLGAITHGTKTFGEARLAP